MANCKAAKKYIKVTERNRVRNQDQKSKVKTLIKLARVSIEEKTVNREELVFNAIKAIDKSTGKNIFHLNNAAKKKSKLQTLLNATGKVTAQEKEKAATATPAKTSKTTKSATAKKTTKTTAAKKETTTAAKTEVPKTEAAKTETPKAETPKAETKTAAKPEKKEEKAAAPKTKAKKETPAPKEEKPKEDSPK